MIPRSELNVLNTAADIIGKGGFGIVRRARWLGGIDVAVKSIPINTHVDLKSTRNELAVLKRLRHPHVIQMMGVVDLQSSEKELWIVLELAAHGSLHDVLALPIAERDTVLCASPSLPGPTAVCLHVVLQIIEALSFMHARSVIHGDIKPANVLLDRGVDGPLVKLTDFGLSSVKSISLRKQSSLAGARGTPGFMSPEVLGGAEPQAPADVFALGMLIVQMLTGNAPFHDVPNEFAISLAIRDGKRPTLPSGLPRTWLLVVKRCWSAHATKRPSASEVKRMLDGQFLEPKRVVAPRQVLKNASAPAAPARVPMALAPFIEASVVTLPWSSLAAALFAAAEAGDVASQENAAAASHVAVRALRVVAARTRGGSHSWMAVAATEGFAAAAGAALGAPCASTNSAQVAADSGILWAVIAALRALGARSAAVAIAASIAIVAIVGGEAHRAHDAISADGLIALVEVMASHATNAGVQMHASAAVGALIGVSGSLEQARRQGAVEAGMLSALVSAIRAHPHDAATQANAAAALANALRGTDKLADACVRSAASAGAITVLVAALREHVRHADVQEHACRALAELTRAGDAAGRARAQEAASIGALFAATSALSAHPSSASVLVNAMWAIARVAAGIDESAAARQQQATEAGAVRSALRARRAHSGDSAVLAASNAVLTVLLTVEDREKAAFEEQSTVVWLGRSMRAMAAEWRISRAQRDLKRAAAAAEAEARRVAAAEAEARRTAAKAETERQAAASVAAKHEATRVEAERLRARQEAERLREQQEALTRERKRAHVEAERSEKAASVEAARTTAAEAERAALARHEATQVEAERLLAMREAEAMKAKEARAKETASLTLEKQHAQAEAKRGWAAAEEAKRVAAVAEEARKAAEAQLLLAKEATLAAAAAAEAARVETMRAAAQAAASRQEADLLMQRLQMERRRTTAMARAGNTVEEEFRLALADAERAVEAAEAAAAEHAAQADAAQASATRAAKFKALEEAEEAVRKAELLKAAAEEEKLRAAQRWAMRMLETVDEESEEDEDKVDENQWRLLLRTAGGPYSSPAFFADLPSSPRLSLR